MFIILPKDKKILRFASALIWYTRGALRVGDHELTLRRPSSPTQTNVSRWCVSPIAPIWRVSTAAATSRSVAMVDRHQSSASCSCQPGLGLVRGKAHRPSATERPSWSYSTALVAVVEESMQMAYVGKRISGHAPVAGGLSVSALLHVVSGGGDVLPPGYELT
jgi:hypothetical protein